MRAPAAIPALALLAGTLAGLQFPDAPRSLLLAILVAACATAVVARQREPVLTAIVIVGFMAGGAALVSSAWSRARSPSLRRAFDAAAAAERASAAAERRIVPEDPGAYAIVDGVLRADASPAPAGVSISLEVTRLTPFVAPALARDVQGGALVSIAGTLGADRLGQWRAGRRVRVPAELHRPTRYLDAGVPDGERALMRRGTVLVGTAKSAALVEVVATGSWLEERMAAARAFSRRAIHDAIAARSPRAAAIVTAIVIGDRAGLDGPVQTSLQQAGTYHVIAISGGNIAILAALMLGAFRLAGWLGRTASLAAAATLILYAGFVGGGASVNRATLMAVVYFAARAADQRSPPLNSLAIAVVGLVAIDPLTVADPAFVLTFGATLAILIAAPLTPRSLPRVVLPAASLFVASLAAEAALFPANAFFFSRVTWAGLVLNFLAIPLMAVAQLAGMAIVPLALMSPALASPAGLVAYVAAEGLVRSAALVRFAPAAAFRLAPPSWWAVVLYYAALVVAWRTRRRTAAGAVAFAAVWILAEPWAWFASFGDGRLHLAFLDVGQGDAAFIRLPHGTTMLVDAGGRTGTSTFDVGDRVVAPVLRQAGVRRLDYLVLTHGDPDHIGGAGAILDEFRPRHVWEGIPVPSFAPLALLRSEAAARGLGWTRVTAGNRQRIDEVDVGVLHPPPPDWERQRVRNDDSIVVELRWRDVSVVLTGDIGAPVERVLSPRLGRAPIRVLKVPHHGSLTSSTPEFLQSARPTIAVFSAGRSNHFGHPAPAVLARYERVGARVLRTDTSGEVDVVTDGYSIDVQTFVK